MLSSFLLWPVALITLAFAAPTTSPNSILCVAGQCLQGTLNISLVVTLSVPSNPSILLLPGEYTSSTQPSLLNDALTSSSATLQLPPGFSNSSATSVTPSPPFTINIQPGILSFPQPLYSAQPTFTQLFTSANGSSLTLPSGSLLIAPNTYAAITSSNNHLIIWDSIPNFSKLPSSVTAGSFVLTNIVSAACSPACSGAGICTPSGTCTCPSGFTGQSCETCASDFFGPSCIACPSDCETCDDGLTGTGKCLVPKVNNPPSSCNCLNGLCGSNGQCTCNSGWITSNNGTACATCAPGFFLDSNGDCSICQLGCTQCVDGTGECTQCKSAFTQNANDNTKCVPVASIPSDSQQECPDGSFNNNGNCTLCSPTCKTCSGPTSNDCIICGGSQFTFNGQCTGIDGNGVCSGTNLVANNLKNECDSCPAKCTSCKISNFNAASTPSQIECTGCLPGFVLSNNQCVEQCPKGTFLGSDSLTCEPCDSSCGTCVGSSTFCLTCANNKLASNGTCVSSCSSSSFVSNGSCLPCHPDCATCSGGAFNQCNTCPPDRPVFTSDGRCVLTCAKNQFLDLTTNKCVQCDSSCSSCVGASANQCMGCLDSDVLQGGSCIQATCTSNSTVVPGLGVCLSDLVVAPNPSAPIVLPTFTPPPIRNRPSHLAWWEILLMALGCAFIFVMFLWLWRRHARKQRAKQTAMFANRIQRRAAWPTRLVNIFRGRYPKSLFHRETEYEKIQRLREKEAARHAHEMSKLEHTYAKSLGGSSTSLTRQPTLNVMDNSDSPHMLNAANRKSAVSLYSQMTGLPRSGPEPKQPTREFELEGGKNSLNSRFSITTVGTYHPRQEEPAPMSHIIPQPRRLPSLTDAREYAESFEADVGAPSGNPPSAQSFWLIPVDPLAPNHTGSSTASKNPFR